MARNGYLPVTAFNPHGPHGGSDGSTPASRIDASGYVWSVSAENVAAGFTAANVVEAWLKSAGHCRNIMNPVFTETGVRFVSTPRGEYSSVETQTFGRPR